MTKLTSGEMFFSLCIGLLIRLLWYLIQRPDPPPTLRPPFPQPPPWTRESSLERDASEPPPVTLTTKTPYNEDEIVEIITKIYKVLVELCSLSADDIEWPPKEGHSINEELCDELELGPAVISLMKKIPYPGVRDNNSVRMELWPYSAPLCYLLDNEIYQGRNIEDFWEPLNPSIPSRKNRNEDFQLDYLLPQEIALTFSPRDGDSIVLDTRENTIRVNESLFSTYSDMKTPDMVLERPEEEDHYRNLVPLHAPSFLRWHLERIESLELIPKDMEGADAFHGECLGNGWIQRKMKKILIEDYGWRENFKREEYQRDMDELWRKYISEWLDRVKWQEREARYYARFRD